MGTKQENTNTMSPFCEAIMEATKDLNGLKGSFDSALILCSDGNNLACRTAGNSQSVSLMIRIKMQQDPVFAETVARAVFEYVFQAAYFPTLNGSGIAQTEKG